MTQAHIYIYFGKRRMCLYESKYDALMHVFYMFKLSLGIYIVLEKCIYLIIYRQNSFKKVIQDNYVIIGNIYNYNIIMGSYIMQYIRGIYVPGTG